MICVFAKRIGQMTQHIVAQGTSLARRGRGLQRFQRRVHDRYPALWSPRFRGLNCYSWQFDVAANNQQVYILIAAKRYSALMHDSANKVKYFKVFDFKPRA